MGALTQRQESQLADARGFLGARMKQFEAALPTHIKPERFLRTVMTALMMKPELLQAPADTLLNECLRAANDGLMPDGKEAALVPRFGREFSLAYQPMIAGIRKKARNSGEISTWETFIVRANDRFSVKLGDDPKIEHDVDYRKERGEWFAVYSIAVLKDGTKSFEVMSKEEVHRIRDRSDGFKAFKAGKIKSTPWASDEEEMARKTVARRHSKVLPTSSDLDRLLYQGEDEKPILDYGELTAAAPVPKSLDARLDALAHDPDEKVDAETGEITKSGAGQEDGRMSGEERETARASAEDVEDPLAEARASGRADAEAGKSKRQMPARFRNDDQLFDAYTAGFDSYQPDA